MTLEPASGGRTAWLEIDLDALRHNVGVIRDLVGPGVAVAPVVKADAYGHGVDTVAPMLAAVSDALCVATLDEALALRANGISGRIILLYPTSAAGLELALEAGIELTLMSESDARALRACMARAPRAAYAVGARQVGAARVQLAIDTGMARGGLSTAGAVTLARALEAQDGIALAGLWTHLADAADPEVSRRQVDRFGRTVEAIRNEGIGVPPRHVAASEAVFARTAPTLEMVRPGLAVYGVLDEALVMPGEGLAAASRLRPAMALKARAVAFSDVATGGRVGYGGQWQASRPSRVAVLPLGYGDGYARGSQPGAEVLLRGRRLPVVGVISMDAITVDVTDVPDIGHEDEFVLLGSQGDATIAVAELARWRNTIAWEVLSGMAPRLERVYNRSAGTVPGDSGGTGVMHDPGDRTMR